MYDIEAIKARHEHCDFVVTKTEWNERAAFEAHTDRATLLSALTAAEARAEAAEAKLAEALLNPVSAAPSPAPDEVEAVARAINPRAWDVMDYALRETQKKYAGQNVAWPVSQFQHAESMDQARAAIAALRPAPKLTEEERARVAEVRQILLDMHDAIKTWDVETTMRLGGHKRMSVEFTMDQLRAAKPALSLIDKLTEAG